MVIHIQPRLTRPVRPFCQLNITLYAVVPALRLEPDVLWDGIDAVVFGALDGLFISVPVPV